MSSPGEALARHEANKARVLNCIPTGYSRYRVPADSMMIASMTRLPERKVREIIEELRRQGHLICNRQDGFGYFIAETLEEVERQYKQDCARSMSILRRVKAFRHALREADIERGDQITWEDLALEEIISKGEL